MCPNLSPSLDPLMWSVCIGGAIFGASGHVWWAGTVRLAMIKMMTWGMMPKLNHQMRRSSPECPVLDCIDSEGKTAGVVEPEVYTSTRPHTNLNKFNFLHVNGLVAFPDGEMLDDVWCDSPPGFPVLSSTGWRMTLAAHSVSCPMESHINGFQPALFSPVITDSLCTWIVSLDCCGRLLVTKTFHIEVVRNAPASCALWNDVLRLPTPLHSLEWNLLCGQGRWVWVWSLSHSWSMFSLLKKW